LNKEADYTTHFLLHFKVRSYKLSPKIMDDEVFFTANMMPVLLLQRSSKTTGKGINAQFPK